MQLTLNRLQNAQELLTAFLAKDTERLKKQLLENELSIPDILALVQPQEGLYFLLNPLGFNEQQIAAILTCIAQQEVGKQFEADQHTLYVDREKLYLEGKAEVVGEEKILIHTPSESISNPIKLNLKQLAVVDSTQVKKSKKGTEFFDMELLEFPLVLRKWLPGDWMIPLGMKGKKKISDILIDAKTPLPKKEEQYVLCSGQNIICLLGVRIDNRFKLSDKTKKVLQLDFKSA
jgi:tRNA(Ile)-lysidine synthase